MEDIDPKATETAFLGEKMVFVVDLCDNRSGKTPSQNISNRSF